MLGWLVREQSDPSFEDCWCALVSAPSRGKARRMVWKEYGDGDFYADALCYSVTRLPALDSLPEGMLSEDECPECECLIGSGGVKCLSCRCEETDADQA